MAWYTSEVEADEIAAYLLSMADKNPKQLIDLFFRFAGVVDEDSAFAPSAEDCKKGFVNGWQHWVFRGKAWVPFLGSPNDTHPSQCFRAYNVDTEIFKQGIPLGRDTAPSEAWRLMQATLTNSPVSLD